MGSMVQWDQSGEMYRYLKRVKEECVSQEIIFGTDGNGHELWLFMPKKTRGILETSQKMMEQLYELTEN